MKSALHLVSVLFLWGFFPVDPAIFVLDKFTLFKKASNGQSFILTLLEIFSKQTELQDSKE